MLGYVKNGLDWSGKTDRLTFFCSAIVLIGFLVALRFAPPFELFYILVLVGIAAGLVLFLGHMRRRLRDAGRSGTWMLLLLMPILHLLLPLILLILPGKKDATTVPRYIPWVGLIVTIALMLLVLSRMFWMPVSVVSGSMKPNFLVGDYVIVTRDQSSDRGAVVLFRHPARDVQFVGRIIGLPGDRVQLQDGVIFLNGTMVAQSEAGIFSEVFKRQGALGLTPRCANGPSEAISICQKYLFSETLPGRSAHKILDILDAPSDNTEIFSVPEGHFFVLGDNRDNSLDSRVSAELGGVGYVPVANIIGRAKTVLLNAESGAFSQFWTWRNDRFLKSVE